YRFSAYDISIGGDGEGCALLTLRDRNRRLIWRRGCGIIADDRDRRAPIWGCVSYGYGASSRVSTAASVRHDVKSNQRRDRIEMCPPRPEQRVRGHGNLLDGPEGAVIRVDHSGAKVAPSNAIVVSRLTLLVDYLRLESTGGIRL